MDYVFLVVWVMVMRETAPAAACCWHDCLLLFSSWHTEIPNKTKYFRLCLPNAEGWERAKRELRERGLKIWRLSVWDNLSMKRGTGRHCDSLSFWWGQKTEWKYTSDYRRPAATVNKLSSPVQVPIPVPIFFWKNLFSKNKYKYQ